MMHGLKVRAKNQEGFPRDSYDHNAAYRKPHRGMKAKSATSTDGLIKQSVSMFFQFSPLLFCCSLFGYNVFQLVLYIRCWVTISAFLWSPWFTQQAPGSLSLYQILISGAPYHFLPLKLINTIGNIGTPSMFPWKPVGWGKLLVTLYHQ